VAGIVSLCTLLLAGCGATAKPRSELRLMGATAKPRSELRLIYRANATAAVKLDGETLERAVRIMRMRLAALGIAGSEVRRVGGREIDVELPDEHGIRLSQSEVGSSGQLFFYDWEPNVIGPNGKPAPTERLLTGGAEAASVRFGLFEYDAVLRAAKRPAIIRSNDTTLTPGCITAQVGGCVYGGWYLLDTRHERMLCAGGKPVCAPQDTKTDLYTDGYRRQTDVQPEAVHVNPGTVLVQAHPEEFDGRVVNSSPNSFYVLNDDPVLSGADIYDPQQGVADGSPDVVFGLYPHGRTVFEQMTRAIAHRGLEAQLPGVSKSAAEQHFAIVFNEQVLSAPSIDFTEYPEGIDAANGSSIAGGFTDATAGRLAAELRLGALPVRLTLVSSQVSPTMGLNK
jgi:SecD/SecF fusion protein